MGGFAGGVSLGTLFIEIEAQVDKALHSLQEFGNDTAKLIEKQEDKWKSFAKIGDTLTDVGTKLTAGITLPIVGIGAAATKAASDFQSSFNQIRAVSDYTEKDLKALDDLAIKLGADTKYSANEAAQAMAEFAAKGFTAKQTMDAMPGSLALAAAGALSVKDAADIASTTLAQFGLKAGEVTRVADLMAKGAASSAIDVKEMAHTLNYVGTIAHDAGMSLEETTTAIALLGNAGIRGEQAGTGLRGVISSLVDPSKEATATLTHLGVATKDVATGGMLPLDQIMQQMQKSGATTADMFTIFGQNAATAASVLKNSAGPAWTEMTKQIDNSEGAAKKMADTLNTGLAGAWEQMKGSLDTVLISLGKQLLPILESVVAAGTRLINEWLLPAVQWFGSLDSSTQGIILTLVGLAAAMGPLLLVAGQLATSIVSINAALGMVGGLGAVAAAATPILIALGVALAGIVVWQAVDYLTEVNSKLDQTGKLFESGARATEAQAQEIRTLEGVLRAHNETVGNQKIAIEKTNGTIDDYIVKLREAAEKTEAFNVGVVGLTVTVGSQVLKSKAFDAELKAVKDSIIEADRKAKLYQQALKELGKETETTGKKHKEAKGEIKKFNDEILLEKLRQAQAEHTKLVKEIAAYEIAAAKAAGKTFDLNAEWEKLTASTNLGAAAIASVTAKLPPMYGAMEEANKTIERQDAAYKALGVTSSAELERIAEAARINFELIANSGIASARDIDAAWVALETARINAARAMGEQISQEQLKTLEKMKQDLEGKVPEMKKPFEGLANSVSTVITNFAQDISKSLWDGDMSWGEKGKSLLKSLGQAVTSSFIEPATKALNDFIAGTIADLLGGKGFGGIMDSIKGIGGAFGGIFGGGDKPAIPGVPSIPGTGGAGGAVGGILGGAMGWVGALGGLAGGILNFIGGMRQEGTMNQVERNTAAASIHLQHILEDGVNKYLPNLEGINLWLQGPFAGWFAELMTTTEGMLDWLKFIEYPVRLINGSIQAIEIDTRAMAQNVERVVSGERILTMNLNGTDPDAVAARVAQQLRLQGAAG